MANEGDRTDGWLESWRIGITKMRWTMYAAGFRLTQATISRDIAERIMATGQEPDENGNLFIADWDTGHGPGTRPWNQL